MHYFSTLFGKELYTFWTDLLSIVRSLNTVFTAIRICHNSYVDGDRGSTVVKVLCYKSEGRRFDPNWCQWIFHRTMVLGSTQPLTEMSTRSISWG